MKNNKPNKSQNKTHLIVSMFLIGIINVLIQELGWSVVPLPLLNAFISGILLGVSVSAILASICLGVSWLIKKELSFTNALIACCYFHSVLILILYGLRAYSII